MKQYKIQKYSYKHIVYYVPIIIYHYNFIVYGVTCFSFQVTNRQTTKTRFLYLGSRIQCFLGHRSIHVLVVTPDTHWNVPASPGEMIFDIDVFLFIYNIIHTHHAHLYTYIMLVYYESAGM